MKDIANRMQAIAAALEADDYRPGSWQSVLADIDALSADQTRTLAPEVTKLSRQLHQRHGFLQVGFRVGYAVEIFVFIAGCLAIAEDSLVTNLAGIFCLGLCLQPLIKISVGLVLGVRYDYAYLWYIEPRFKMQYGSYLILPGERRVLLHLIGSIGTPLAMLIAVPVMMPHYVWLGYGDMWMVLAEIVNLDAERRSE